VSNIFRTTWDRGWSFIKRAGTVILAASVIIWTLNSLSFEGGIHYIGESDSQSILALIGGAIAWIFKPLGFGNWQSAVATLLGLMAKEEVVGTFGTLSSMANADLAMGGDSTAYAVIAKEFFGSSGLAGVSFMLFNLLCAPCFAAMGAIKKEMNSAKWSIFTIGYMCAFAYAVSLIVYQIGAWFSPVLSGSIVGTIAALLALATIIFLVVRPVKKN
jgi:ferrous iron transport protein B